MVEGFRKQGSAFKGPHLLAAGRSGIALGLM